jgi:hypothetical protein
MLLYFYMFALITSYLIEQRYSKDLRNLNDDQLNIQQHSNQPQYSHLHHNIYLEK